MSAGSWADEMAAAAPDALPFNFSGMLNEAQVAALWCDKSCSGGKPSAVMPGQ